MLRGSRHKIKSLRNWKISSVFPFFCVCKSRSWINLLLFFICYSWTWRAAFSTLPMPVVFALYWSARRSAAGHKAVQRVYGQDRCLCCVAVADSQMGGCWTTSKMRDEWMSARCALQAQELHVYIRLVSDGRTTTMQKEGGKNNRFLLLICIDRHMFLTFCYLICKC